MKPYGRPVSVVLELVTGRRSVEVFRNSKFDLNFLNLFDQTLDRIFIFKLEM